MMPDIRARPRLVQGALTVTPPRQVSGWCLLPDDDAARVTIEMLVNGRVVAAMVAAQRFAGAGDGRHGFALSLPVALAGPATTVIEARERSTGTVFGRAVLFAEHIARPIENRLAALDRSVLRSAMIGQMHTQHPGLRQAIGGVGAALLDLAVGEVRGERSRLRRRAPRLALGGEPWLTVMVPAAAAVDRTLDRLTALQTLCDKTSVEIVLVDDGTDPATTLLPPLLPGLRYVRDRRGLTGSVLNLVAAEARGDVLCFLDQEPPADPWGWPQLGARPDAVHVGAPVAALLSRAAAHLRPALRSRGPHSVALHLSRALLREAGGFDSALQGPHAYADVALKCSVLGAPVIGWVDPDQKARGSGPRTPLGP